MEVEEVSEDEALLAVVLRVVEEVSVIEEAMEAVEDSVVPQEVVASRAALLIVVEVVSVVVAPISAHLQAFGKGGYH